MALIEKRKYYASHEFEFHETDIGRGLSVDSPNPFHVAEMVQNTVVSKDFEPYGLAFAERDSEDVEEETLYLDGNETDVPELSRKFGRDFTEKMVRLLRYNLTLITLTPNGEL